MMLFTFLIPALIIVAAISLSNNNKKKLRAIKVPVNKRKS
ncbi:hypothetical protein SAMN05192545_2203 [Maribacter dokdonensis]|uniref:Uncharacterized protein n=1 Tax=Maribacter dokdonensis TaxID=320912 RepID=A0ABY0UL35_9FLAO|nr:hypothetical protein SAMN05192545_2203 [Maribacter dokdonensis]